MTKALAEKAAPEKAAAKKAAPKKAVGRNAAAKKVVAKKMASKKAPAPVAGRRADFGGPVDGFFARQPPALKPILEALRALVEKAAPDATAALKWGMPCYIIDGTIMCALAGHKSHVNLVLSGPPGTYADPDGLLQGDGKTGRRLVLRSLDDLPQGKVRAWLRTAAETARRR